MSGLVYGALAWATRGRREAQEVGRGLLGGGGVLVLDLDGGYMGVAFLTLSICILCIFIDVYYNTLK